MSASMLGVLTRWRATAADDDLDDLDDDTCPAAAAGFGLYDAHKEADKW